MMNLDSKDMRHLKEWAKDKNGLFAMIAFLIASAAADPRITLA
jgi:hypothetical protein